MPRRSGDAGAVRRSAPVFAALGDQIRLRVVARLCEAGPLSITQLAEGAHVTRQAVTKHLQVLQQAGLVKSARKGRENVFRLQVSGLHEAKRFLEIISHEWDERIERLRAHVEK